MRGLRSLSAGLVFTGLLAACHDTLPTAPETNVGPEAPHDFRATFVSVDGTWLLLTPTGLDFGPVATGTVPPSQVAEVSNVGTSPITLSMAGGAPPAPFNGAQACQSVTLQPGESCQIIYSFTPAMAGPATGTSSFTLNGQPFSVELQGVGVGPQFRVTPNGLDFGQVPVGSPAAGQTAEVTNIGTSPVTISMAGGAPPAPFNGAQACQGVTLQPGESCQIIYSFTPAMAGPATGTSSFTLNGQPFSVELQGVGVGPQFRVTPNGLDFGQVPVGSAAAGQTAEVTNIGTSPVTVSMAGGAPPAPFNGAQACQGMTLQPGESCQILFAFAPTAEGSATGTSSFTLNGQPFSVELAGVGIASGATPTGFRVTPNGLDFGQVPVGSVAAGQTAEVTNIGTSPVTVSMTGGAPPAPFNGAQACQGVTLQPGESCQIIYGFSPTAEGPATGTSSFTINGQPFSVELQGVGVGPQFRVTPNGLDFGQVPVGSPAASQTAEVTNIGASAVTISMAGGAPPAPFNGAQACQGATLQPGESCQIIYSFTPAMVGPATGTSSFTLNGQSFSVELQGTGVGPRFRVTPNGLDFGGVALGETSAQQMTHITNVGASPVTISMAGGAPGAPFNGAQNCQGMTLQPGESCQIVYGFTPAMVGLATAASSFTLNGQPFSVRLEGTGLPSSLLAVEFLPPLKPGRSFVAGATIPVKFALLDQDGMRIPDADALSLAAACAVTVSFSGGDPDPNCARYEPDDDHFMFLLRVPPALPPGTYTISATVQSGPLTLGTGSIQVQIRNPPM